MRVASHPFSVASIERPGRDHPSQLPITWISDAVLAGWYHTVTEQERSGTAGAADDP